MTLQDPNLAAPEIHDFTEAAAFCKVVTGNVSLAARISFAMLTPMLATLLAFLKISASRRVSEK